MVRATVLTVSACFLLAPIVRADDTKIESLRRQIESLQRQLDSVQEEKRDAKVTRIGSPRLRHESALVLRIYDLSDLFTIAPSYHAEFPREFGQQGRLVFPVPGDGDRLSSGAGVGGRGIGSAGGGGFGGGMGGGGVFQVNDQARSAVPEVKITLHDLISAIKEVVQPDAWKDNDGTASITALGNALLVSADEEIHSQVRDLLNLFRQRWGTLRTVSVQAWWLWLDDAQLHSLLADGTAAATEPKAFGLVNPSAWNKLTQELHSAPRDARRLGYRATVTCYNGQIVHVMSDGQRLAVTDVRPVVVPSDGSRAPSVALQPEMSVINEGAVLQVRPIANISGKTVVLDVHSRVNVRHDVEQASASSEKAGKTKDSQLIVPVVDRNLQLLTNRLSTTLRVPVDRLMLVGGMTFEEQPVPGERSLYLFVRCSVQELRNDQDEPRNAVVPKAPAPGSADVGK